MTVVESAQHRFDAVRISPHRTIECAIKQLDLAGTGALVLCEEGDRFRGLLTDGDIRRGFLRGVTFQDPCSEVATQRPLTVPPTVKATEMLQIMNRIDINHLPLVDNAGRATGLILRRDLMVENHLEMSAVIMAGGLGTRLLPLTLDVPKPMLPVGDRPLMELTLERLRKAGIRHVNVTTHHLSDKIKGHFRDGHDFGVDLTYVTEEHPLGTAGGLGFLSGRTEPILVINGDVLTAVNYNDLFAFHRDNRADLTVGVRLYEMEVPYGVVDCEGTHVKRVREKPTIKLFVNAGVYVLEPLVSYFIPAGRRCDMTDLIKELLEAGRNVVSFPIMEYWLDIGQHKDYARANEDVRLGKMI